MNEKTDSKDEGSLLGRWAARKRAAQRGELDDEPVAEAAISDPVPETGLESIEPDELTPEQLEMIANREAAEAVDIDALDYDSDFTVFQKIGVPEVLRRKAMQKLWRSNPILANVDGLCDYDDDFASPDLILKNFESAYKIGKGYLLSDEDIEAAALERKEKEAVHAAKKAAEREEAERLQAEQAEHEEVTEESELASDEGEGEEAGEPSEVAQLGDTETIDAVEAAHPSAPEMPKPAKRVSLRQRLEMG